jgi:hypothetical protein
MKNFYIVFPNQERISLPLSSAYHDDLYWFLSKADVAELKELCDEQTEKDEQEE